MSEQRHIIGPVIDCSQLQDGIYHFGEGTHTDVWGIRMYKTEENPQALKDFDITFYNTSLERTDTITIVIVNTPTTEDYRDINLSKGNDPIFGPGSDNRTNHILQGASQAYYAWNPKFSVIYIDQTIYVDEHIARIEIDGEATVKFSRQHPVYGIYGENVIASFDEDFQEGDQGVYDTSATGTTIMENHQQKDTIYLKGTGTVTVWAGLSAVNFPFKAQGKGGGSGGTIYRTTTVLTDGATTNPITVDGEEVTVKSGDFAIYSKAEFVFDGTQWDELGDTSGLGDLAYKDSASGTASVSVTGTTDGSVTISPTKETIYSTTNKGTLPSFTYNSTTEELTFNAGTLPSTTGKSVVTNATATFTGASTTSTGTVNVTVS